MKQVWDQALAAIRARVTDENFTTYFQPLRYVGATENVIELTVDDPFFCQWVQQHYQDLLDSAVSKVLDRPMRVSIGVREPDAVVHTVTTPPPAASAPAEADGFQAWQPYPLNPHYAFDTFVVGPNNEMAHAASDAVSREPAKTFNPLFIYGGTGLGKTHLLHAVAHRILETNPGARVTYISAEEFTNQVIKSISQQQMGAFRERYRSHCDVLLMDDVQVLAGKERTQEEFFHTFNALHAAQKQIVLTSDQTPQNIEKLEERLRSRFQWGLITDIKPPQFETRVAILQRKASRDGIHLPDDVAFYLARLIRSNVRELEGALTRLAVYASVKRQELTIEFANEALSELLENRAKALTIDAIQKLVAEHFDVKVSDLRGPRRHRVISHPRSIAMYLCRKHTQSSYPAIGRGFGGKDHSTVMAAYKKIKRGLEQDLALRSEVEALERKLPG